MQSDFISLLDAPVTLVPLRARDGTIRAFAQIDAADAAVREARSRLMTHSQE